MSDKGFRITTAWVTQAGENPWLLEAYDEYTEDAWGGEPDHFKLAVEKAMRNGDEVRIVELTVDYSLIEERFSAVSLDAQVEDTGEPNPERTP